MFVNFDFYDHLGSRSYFYADGSGQCYPTFEDCVSNFAVADRIVDPTAILGILMKNYPIGTRTLIKGIQRTPWMARPDGQGGWQSAALPFHGSEYVGPEDAASELSKRLREEALTFLGGKKTVGILLSGGMDSRVVAGVMRQLQKSGDFRGDIVALTWGTPNSRDVVYAEQIASAFGWGYKHFPLSAEGLARNIMLAADRGAEYSPVHLHAMEAVSQVQGLDGVLAGSFGDSIGRGEYSGIRVEKLPGILDQHLNHFAFLLRDLEKQTLPRIQNDLVRSRQRFPGRSEIAYREIDRQMHYLQRQLNPCMSVIDDQIPLYQMFGAPEVFGYMWSLAPECRTDDVYEHLLGSLPKELHAIPWARTGKKYNQAGAPVEDGLSKLNAHYGEWLRNDLRELVLDAICSGELQRLGIFNERSIAMWARYWPADKRAKADRLDEKMAWLASLAVFLKKFNVQGEGQPGAASVVDDLARLKALGYNWAYQTALKVLKK